MYDRWCSNYSNDIISLKSAIDRLAKDQSMAYKILNKHMNMLTDIKYVYCQADTAMKREFINLGFDSNLYYQDGVYRTPTMMEIFTHDSLIMKEKALLS